MDGPQILSVGQREVLAIIYRVGRPITASKIVEAMGNTTGLDRVRRTMATLYPAFIDAIDDPDLIVSRCVPDLVAFGLTARGLEMIANITEAMNPSRTLASQHRLRQWRAPLRSNGWAMH